MLETDLFISFLGVLRNQPVLALFLIIGIGYLIGGIKLRQLFIGAGGWSSVRRAIFRTLRFPYVARRPGGRFCAISYFL